MSTYKSTKNKKKNSISRIIIGTMCLLGIGGGCLYTIERYNEPKLIGSWISKETGDEVIFNADGTMTLNEVIDVPTYQILSPTKMLYNIEGKQFEMYYNLDGRLLSWGMDETNTESFDRK